MGDIFRHVQRGDPLPDRQETWNGILDAARLVHARRLGPAGGGQPAFADGPYCLVLVRNDAGADLPRGSVLRATDVLVSPVDLPYEAQRQPAFSAEEPTATTDAVLITVEAIPADAFGRAVAAGVAVCDVDVADSAHLYAVATVSDSTKLTSAATGQVRILWRESGSSGTKRAVVLVNGHAAGGTVLDASLTQSGIINLSDFQVLGDGIKYFPDPVEVNTTGRHPTGNTLFACYVPLPLTHKIINVLAGSTWANRLSHQIQMFTSSSHPGTLTINGTLLVNDGTDGPGIIKCNSYQSGVNVGQTGTYAGMTFTAGLLTGGSFSGAGITSIDGSTPTSLTGYFKGNGTDVDVQATPIPITDTEAKVSSVGLTMPGGFTVTSSPVTSSGTLAVTLTGEVERAGAARLYGTAGGNGYLELWESGTSNWIRMIAYDTGFAFEGTGVFDAISLTAPLDVASGGTGASDAATARTNLELAYASQAEQETGTATDRVVAPGTQKFHPSAAKAWVYFTVSGTTVTVRDSYNVASVTRTGTGLYTVTFTTAFSSAYYAMAQMGAINAGGTQFVNAYVNNSVAPTASACAVLFVNLNSVAADDPGRASLVFYGDQ